MKSGRILAAAALAAVLAWPVAAQEKGAKGGQMKMGSQTASVTATVEAIDSAKRELTLKGPEGNVVVLGVPDSVKRFNEIKVGDRLTFKYTEAVALEVKKADSGAKLGMSAETGMEPIAGKRPAGVVSRKITATVAVEAVDANAPSISVRTADGNKMSFRVQDPKKLEGVHPGDKIVVTYSEALAITVSDAPK
jgi:Cu/Ag efflux protein CusF